METIIMGTDEQKCFDTLFQWECKAMNIYGNERVKGFFRSKIPQKHSHKTCYKVQVHMDTLD